MVFSFAALLAGWRYVLAVRAGGRGFGWQSVPGEIDTVADLRKLIPVLENWGYPAGDIERIFCRNWQDLLAAHLPEAA